MLCRSNNDKGLCGVTMMKTSSDPTIQPGKERGGQTFVRFFFML